jgi:beta-glucosidase
MPLFLPEIESLELPALIAQMVVVRASGFLFDQQIRYPQWEPPAETLRYWLETLGVGGVILLGGSAPELALRSHQLQEWAKIPLLLAADVEEGVGQRFPGATWFPPPMALAAMAHTDLPLALHAAEEMGATIAQEAQAIGLNWVLAPVVDVNNNPKNPVINVRAFGETVNLVSPLAVAFIQGAQRYPVLTVAKHFPGHGDTAVDSHLALPILPHSLERLQQVELPPFQAAIAAGVDSVMTAHLQIPALDATYPATLSDRVLTRLLRQTLGFDGIIVTDALIMGAIAQQYGANEAAVLAVEAGADVLMMPADPEGAIQAVCQAVEEGRIPLDQVQASVERIWRAKQRVCAPNFQGEASHAWETLSPTVQPQRLAAQLAQPPAIALVDKILRQSNRYHCPIRLSPSELPVTPRNLILIDTALNSKELGLHTPAVTIPKQLGYQLQLIDSQTPAITPMAFPSHSPTLLQLFLRDNPFRGSAELTHLAQTCVEFLLQTQQLQAIAIYGSPYLVDNFLPHLPPEIPYVFSYGQMPQAQAIALEALFSQT